MISIIMPVYNSEKYLEQAIESVIHQEYVDFELILVDDGSTDTSGVICDIFSKRDSRIRVFHKENGGVSEARRFGYKEAKGNWISFMDNDDVLSPKCLSSLYEYSNQADVIIGRGMNIESQDLDNLSFDEEWQVGNKYLFSGLQAAELFNTPGEKKYGIVTLLWGKIISRAVMEQIMILLDEKSKEIPYNFFEDLFVVPRIFVNAKQVVIRDELLYYHRECTDSPSHTMNMKQYNYEQIEVVQINLQYYKEHKYIELYRGQLPHYFLIVLKIWYACNENEKNVETIKMCNEKVDRFYKKYYADLRKNKYVKLIYKIVIELFTINKTLWCFLVGKVYFESLYKIRDKIIK